ncbi:hypothetical protein [Fibrobacter sp.]|uniref:hypothetical protein n=1 Tax=Fibrobacter sp. TaxID=35828 RepID=UPI00386D012B
MKKFYLLALMVFFLNFSNAFASEKTQTPLARHSLSFEYDFLTVTDFASAIASIFDDDASSQGAISADYGYTFATIFETGFVFNYAIMNKPVVTFMPKIRINGNLGGSINPFMELDMGVTYSSYTNYFIPMGHFTLLGLEIGYPVSFRFQIPFMLWGQRGATYLGMGVRF